LANIGEVGHSRIYLGDRCFIHLLKNRQSVIEKKQEEKG
jgi:hypothetical protein